MKMMLIKKFPATSQHESKSVAPFTQPDQGRNVTLLFRLAVLYKKYEDGMGDIVPPSVEPSVEPSVPAGRSEV